METPEPVESWEKEKENDYLAPKDEFDHQFLDFYFVNETFESSRPVLLPEDVRGWARWMLRSQKQKQIEEFVSMLEDLGNDPIKTDPDELPKTEVEVRCFQYGYKTAKDDIITKLRA